MDDLLSELFARVNYERHVPPGPASFKLRNMRRLLAELGNPELAFPVIHVAGTKGKGTVATMVAAILSQAGWKTGLYTSPHLESLNERMTIDGIPIAEGELEATLGRLQPAVSRVESGTCQPAAAGAHPTLEPNWASSPPGAAEDAPRLTFFEIVTAAALEFFAHQRCQAVVLEVGLGGRLDSTNVCQPEVSVITSISFDHTRQLGETLPEIAAEKAGIIKPGVPVVSGVLEESARQVIHRIADQRQAPLIQLGQHFRLHASDAPGTSPDDSLSPRFGCSGTLPLNPPGTGTHTFERDSLELALPGRHQRQNASLAVATVEVLRAAGWDIDPQAIRRGLNSVRIAGRTEFVGRQPWVMLDIAHNVASIRALLQALEEECPAWRQAPRKHLIFGTSQDKDVQGMLNCLDDEFDSICLTQFRSNPRGLELDQLRQMAEARWSSLAGEGQPGPQLDQAATPWEAWRQVRASAGADDFVLITGSAFLVAELRGPLRDAMPAG